MGRRRCSLSIRARYTLDSITESRFFPEQIRKLSAGSGSFAIHLGDMKQETKQCTELFYKNVSAVLRNASLPVFIVPGDNDWYVVP